MKPGHVIQCSNCRGFGHTRQWCPICEYCKCPRDDGKHNPRRNYRDECPVYQAARSSGTVPGREEEFVRELAARQKAGEHVFKALSDFLEPLFKDKKFALSFDIQINDKEMSWKRNGIHELLKSEAAVHG